MIPTKRLYTILWLSAIMGIVTGVFTDYMVFWWGMVFLIVSLLILEILVLYSKKQHLQIERIVQHALSLGVWSPVRIKAKNLTGRTLRMSIYDHHPIHMEVQGSPQNGMLRANVEASYSYRVRPTHRGIDRFPKTQMRIRGPLGLLTKNESITNPTEVRTYPNFSNVIKYTLLTHQQRQNQMGIRKRRRRGEGQDFRQLREFRKGDSVRQVDWNATSRMSKLISREYQDERDQRVVFLLDCSRRMLTVDGALSHFDHTLNALLLMSYVATRQGDAVGLMTFSGDDRWIAPRKGAHAVNGILDKIFDLQPSYHSADYVNCAQRLQKLLHKRSLIILVTNLRDEDSDELIPALSMLKSHHLVLVASMREAIIDHTLKQPVEDFNRALEQAATHLYLDYRKKLIEQIRRQNILMVDVLPEQLPVSLVNSYLEIKSAGLL